MFLFLYTAIANPSETPYNFKHPGAAHSIKILDLLKKPGANL
jgi:hypothetical protein